MFMRADAAEHTSRCDFSCCDRLCVEKLLHAFSRGGRGCCCDTVNGSYLVKPQFLRSVSWYSIGFWDSLLLVLVVELLLSLCYIVVASVVVVVIVVIVIIGIVFVFGSFAVEIVARVVPIVVGVSLRWSLLRWFLCCGGSGCGCSSRMYTVVVMSGGSSSGSSSSGSGCCNCSSPCCIFIC